MLINRSLVTGVLLLLAGSVAFGQAPAAAPPPPLPFANVPAEWRGRASVLLEDNVLAFFSGTRFAVFSLAADQIVSTGTLTAWPGWPTAWQGVDGAARFDADTIVLIAGSEWVPYSVSQRAITMPPQALQNWTGFPWSGIDAVVNWDAGSILFFRGTEFLRYTMAAEGGRFDARGDYTQWTGWPRHWDRVTGVVNPGKGVLFFFRQNEVLPYALDSSSFGALFTLPGPPPVPDAAPVPAQQQAAPLPTLSELSRHREQPVPAPAQAPAAPAAPLAPVAFVAPAAPAAAPFPAPAPAPSPAPPPAPAATSSSPWLTARPLADGDSAETEAGDQLTISVRSLNGNADGLLTCGDSIPIEDLLSKQMAARLLPEHAVAQLAAWCSKAAAGGARRGDKWKLSGTPPDGMPPLDLEVILLRFSRRDPVTGQWTKVNN